jgi:hypothetical protein
MFEAIVKWSRERLLWTLALYYVAILEGVSWLTSRGPVCIVETVQDGCPTLHAFFITSTASILEAIGHDWIIAISTSASAIFTATLWWSTRKLWKAGDDQLSLAREEFNSTHRPRVVLRELHFSYEDQTQNVPVVCIFTNIGGTDAKVVELDVAFTNRPNRLFRPVPRQASVGTPFVRVLKNGERFSHIMPSGLAQSDIAQIGGQPLYYTRGTITYVDKSGIRRSTGFCRDYDTHDGCFHKTDMAEGLGYEYED